ncbi:hypothetical protein BFJ70_g1387 [Fusarium oxysporum]|nr:hypothetical protein BFJ66_g466 [Fusarium oxysporum f. sp. cepae]RKL06214.1 hypothetical protein BFJ71_g2775 [Fusarium oxysporum]RKL50223.1 hypothetical protein BFJ70_g1387 [Fusarium oxysporum]
MSVSVFPFVLVEDDCAGLLARAVPDAKYTVPRSFRHDRRCEYQRSEPRPVTEHLARSEEVSSIDHKRHRKMFEVTALHSEGFPQLRSCEPASLYLHGHTDDGRVHVVANSLHVCEAEPASLLQ